MIKGSIQKAINSGAKNNTRYVIEKGNHLKAEFKKFNINEAIYFFSKDFLIYVENDLYDKCFVKSIFKYFDSSRRFESYSKKGIIEFRNSGGIDGILNTLKNKLDQISEIENLNTAFPQKYVNAFAIFDSDKTYPDEVIEKNIRLIEKLDQLGVGYHMLEKRSMENYLPDDAFNELETKGLNHNKKWISVYRNLTPTQKDHLKYDVGFKNKSKSDLSVKVTNLYSNISEPNYIVLNEGIQLESYKKNIAELFNSPLVHKTSLLERGGGTDGDNELNKLIEKVNSFL